MGAGHGIGIKRNDYHRRNRRRNISMHKHSYGVNTESSYLRIVNTPVVVPSYDRATLESESLAHFKAQAINNFTIAKMCVTYLRHEHSPYEVLLRSRKWQHQNRDAYLLISKRVFDAIAKANPWLADECTLQYEERSGTAFTLRQHVRIVKGGGLLTRAHIAELNEREHELFTGIENEYEPSGFWGEDDGTFRDAALTSLASSRLLYRPPFLKPAEIRERRFNGSLNMNDRWWEWEEEKGLRTVEPEQRFRWAS